MTSQVIKSSMEELKAITKVDLAVFDTSGRVITCTYEENLPAAKMVEDFAGSMADSLIMGTHHFLKVFEGEDLLYVLDANGAGDDAYMIGRVAASQLKGLAVAYKEKLDKGSFFQNLILDNMLLIDVYNRARKLRIDPIAKRTVFLVEVCGENDSFAQDYLSGMFTSQNGDYVTAVDESNIVLIKTIGEKEGYEELSQVAETIVDMMSMEAMLNVRVAYGTIVDELKDVSKSYKEAKMAMEVGKIFYSEKKVTAYNTLGIGRLIYQLPANLCRIFMEEIFGNNIPDRLDEETLTTINKFFENNLNISETSRQLFVHRNTLVYRIEKLQKSTGLDIRIFDDALTFKIALMVADYMKYLNAMDYR